MFASKTADNGIINKETIFHFKHEDKIISASYKGGQIEQGYLLGTIENGKLNFKYVQIHSDLTIETGSSVCEILVSENRIKLLEHFEWKAGTGTNVIEEF